MSVLNITDLCVDIGERRILDRVGLTLEQGTSHALVGESGSGKSMTTKAILRILPSTARVSGSVTFDGRDVLALSPTQLRKYRGSDVSIIFQDPKAHINPVRTIGSFLTERIRDQGVSKDEARTRAVNALGAVGITHPESRLRQYPHSFSGGMLQRVMIASVVLASPQIVLADEPTTALDVTTQAEVMSILHDLQERNGMSLLLITHDLELATATCDTISVMYGGRILETQSVETFERGPSHPYSRALARSRPSIHERAVRLPVLDWTPDDADDRTEEER